jgi:hypothetical protein
LICTPGKSHVVSVSASVGLQPRSPRVDAIAQRSYGGHAVARRE